MLSADAGGAKQNLKKPSCQGWGALLKGRLPAGSGRERRPKRLPHKWYGALAQLGERLHGMQEVSGSIPLGSTIHLEFALARYAG